MGDGEMDGTKQGNTKKKKTGAEVYHSNELLC